MKIFKKGQKVHLESGGNASQFNMKEYGALGPYNSYNYLDKEFTIEGTIKLISFEHSPEVYGAYLLLYNGDPVGYAYNSHLTYAEGTEELINSEVENVVSDESKEIIKELLNLTGYLHLALQPTWSLSSQREFINATEHIKN